jgi:hypothetical protein
MNVLRNADFNGQSLLTKKDTLIPKLVYDHIPTERTNVDRQKESWRQCP